MKRLTKAQRTWLLDQRAPVSPAAGILAIIDAQAAEIRDLKARVQFVAKGSMDANVRVIGAAVIDARAALAEWEKP